MNRVSAEANVRHVQLSSEAGGADLLLTSEPDTGRARAGRCFALPQDENEDSLACLVREFQEGLRRPTQLNEPLFSCTKHHVATVKHRKSPILTEVIRRPKIDL